MKAMLESIPLPTVEQVESIMQSAGLDTSRITIGVSRCADTGHPIVTIMPIASVYEIELIISVSDKKPSPDDPLKGPPYVQVKDSQYCSSAWDENCCDLPNGHDEPHWDKTNGNRWTATESTNDIRKELDALDGTIVLPNDVHVEVLECSGEAAELFKRAKDDADRAMTLAILGTS